MNEIPEPVYVALVGPNYLSGERTRTFMRTEIFELIQRGEPVYVIAEEGCEIPEYLESQAQKVFRYKKGASFGEHLAAIQTETGSTNVSIF